VYDGRPRRLQRILIERAAAMSNEPAETRGHHRAHLPTRL
jgi:hypothetical protein